MAESNAVSTSVHSTQGQMALQADDQLAFIADAARTFEGIQKLAGVISSMECCPAHLKGKAADCFRVVTQAVKWRMDPFAVAECTSLVHGRLCYEGKLVAAVLRSMGAIVGRLEHEITGSGQDASIVITGTPKGARKAVAISGSVKLWRTHGKDKQGNPMKNAWDTMPETMLVYRGTRQWARVHAPEAILGVYTPDEMDEVREVEVVAVHSDPPAARTGTVTAQSPAEAPTGTNAAPAETSPGTAPAAPAAPLAYPAINAARELFRTLNYTEKGLGKSVIARLCKLHGGPEPMAIAADKLDAFGQDVAKISEASADKARVEDLLSTWEHAEQEGKA